MLLKNVNRIFDTSSDIRRHLILRNRANPNEKDDCYKKTALHYAAQKGNIDICQLLISNRANPNLKDSEEKTALHYAAEKGISDVCQMLLSKGAKPEPTDSEKNSFALFC